MPCTGCIISHEKLSGVTSETSLDALQACMWHLIQIAALIFEVKSDGTAYTARWSTYGEVGQLRQDRLQEGQEGAVANDAQDKLKKLRYHGREGQVICILIHLYNRGSCYCSSFWHACIRCIVTPLCCKYWPHASIHELLSVCIVLTSRQRFR